MALLHGLKHKGKVYSCPHCDLKYASRSSFMKHLRVKHVTNFVCEFCGYSFVNAKGVFVHKAIKHEQEKGKEIVATAETTCPTCNIGFASDKALETHLKVSHLQQQPNIRGRPDIICEICGVKTTGSKRYRNHFRVHHPNTRPTQKPNGSSQAEQQYMCEQCGKIFKKKQNLKMHVASHTGERLFECHDCNKTFLTKPTLQNHIQKLHLPRKYPEQQPTLYPCNLCGKAFHNQNNVKRHLVVHTGLRQFVCEICGSSFKTKTDVQTHNTHVHLKKPWPKKNQKRS